MFCSKCGKKVPNDSVFCPECGAKQEEESTSNISVEDGLTKKCSGCGCQMPSDSRFCPECRMKQKEILSQPKETISKSKVIQQSQTKVLSPEEASKLKKRNKIIAILISSALGLCLIIGLLSIFIKPTINLNNYLTVSFEGYNTVGKASISFDIEKFESDYEKKLSVKLGKKSTKLNNYKSEEAYFESLLGSYNGKSASGTFLSNCVNGSIDIQSGLSNGDVVTYTWDCNDEYALEKYGYKLKYNDVEHKVADLKEAETFDPFDGIEVMFEGIAPSGAASISGEPKSSAAKDFRYNMDNYERLSNGDKVTVTVSMNYGDDPIEYCIEKYGMIPSSVTRDYTVEGLNNFISSISDLSEVGLKEMQSQAEDVYNADIAQNWGEDEILKSFTYIGNYLLTTKSSDDWGSDNVLYLVYKVQVEDNYSNGGEIYKKTNDIYWYISYNNLLVNPQGEITVNIMDYSVPRDRVTIDSGISSEGWGTKAWYYVGYQTLEELYKVVVTSNSATYNHEDNIDGNAMVSETDQYTTERDGVIFSDSSEELLTEDTVAMLSEDDLRHAINELYARHGYIFKDEELKEYYGKFDWYTQEIEPEDFSLDLFNDIEKENIEMLQKERENRN